MVSERQKEHKGSDKIPINGSKKNHGGTKQPSISGLRYVISTLRANGNDSIYLENFIRELVRDVVERKVQERLLPSEKVNDAGIISEARDLELCFINNQRIPDTVFTKSSIISKDKPLQIALVDVRSKSIVNDGPFSSTKIEICALDGEFGSCGNEDWTETQFNDNILRERDGKEPLLVGTDKIITLENGVASISKIMFTDNSRWLRGNKFRLGVKAMQNGEKIKEGRSQPFRVKDNRGESYQKHYPPGLNDDVWRLKKIAKDGIYHKRLSSKEIHTVKDLLKLLITNESLLHKIFGKIPKKSWLAIIEHAKTCIVDDHKLYGHLTNLANGQQIVLIFNAIFELVGVTYDLQNYCIPETLTSNLQNIVKSLKQDAYKNVDNNLEPIDEAQLNSISLAACLKSAAQSDAPVQGLQHTDISTTQGQKETGPGYVQPCTSTSYANEGMNNCQINVDSVPKPNIREIPQNNHVEGERYNEEDNYESQVPAAQDGYSILENLINDIWSSENAILFNHFDGAECSTHVNFVSSITDISNNGKPKAVWRKIRAVIKWGISVRKVAAAKRSY